MTNLLIGFTLPKTRRVLWHLIRHHGSVMLQLLLFVGWFTMAWPGLRGVMNDLGTPRYGAGVEEHLFGGLPTVWLQELYGRWHGFAWGSVAIHASWFVVPWVAVAVVLVREPQRLPSFLRWWSALLVLCLPMFALLPMKPPWMADGDVIRINATIVGAIPDNNPFAAMPSLHVALPLVLALWFYRERWFGPAKAMLAYSAIVALEVVFSGEHYVVDVLGAAAVAGLVAVLARLDYGTALNAATRRLPRLSFQPRQRAPQSALLMNVARVERRERAQTLLEFAFVAPIMIIFLFVIVDFGIALDRRVALQHAVREGARRGAVTNDIPSIIDTTVNQSQGLLDPADVDVCYEDVDVNGNAGDPGDNVRVTAHFTYQFTVAITEVFNALGASLPTAIDMDPSADMRLENSVNPAPPCT